MPVRCVKAFFRSFSAADYFSASGIRAFPRVCNRKTKRIVTETGEEVPPEDLHHYADFCGRVSLQPADTATMKRVSNSLDSAGLVVLGFKPMRFLRATSLLSRNILAVPNDARVQGSGKAMYNLKQSMVKKGVFAVGELLLRAGSSSKMVALVPKKDASDCFYITHLPFKEDLREVPQKDICFADRRSVDAAKDLIKKSTLRVEEGSSFADNLPPNPWLRHFFGYLESVSIGRPLVDVEDDAKMDVEGMLRTASEEIASFSISLPEDEQPVKKERKRKAPSSSTSSKEEFVKEPISDEWIEMYKNNELGDLKNDELKAFLKGQGERLAGKKADLIDRCIRCIQKELFKE